MKPHLLTFDIFGTVVDWRRGLREAVETIGIKLSDAGFDRVVDRQGELESESFRPYREITAISLRDVLGIDPAAADRIAADVGRWPLFDDAREALRQLGSAVPCVAMTNSDRTHGEQVQEGLGFRLAGWVCAEDVGLYKPAAAFWSAVADRLSVPFDDRWWHVSAYADYDLDAAGRLGLTTVFVRRPHARSGPATHEVAELCELAERLK